MWFLMISFIVLLFAGIPTVLAMGLPCILYLLSNGTPISMMSYTFFTKLNTFSFLAVPMFTLMGILVNDFGETDNAFEAARRLMKGKRGYSARINVIISLVFAGMSGAALADVNGLGNIEIDAMEGEGYTREYASALTIATAVVGPIFPPSIPMVLFAILAEVSSVKCLIAGMLPGVLVSALLLLYVIVMDRRKLVNPPKHMNTEELDAVPLKQVVLKALPITIAPVLIIISMLKGVMSPGETGAVACLYMIFVTILHKTFTLRKFIDCLKKTLRTCCPIMIISIAGDLFSRCLVLEHLPEKILGLMGSAADSKLAVLVVVNIILLILGMFMESNSAMFLASPIILSMTTPLGLDPIHMGVMIVFNLMIGLTTPPFGMSIFAVSKVGRVSPQGVIKEVAPMWIPLVLSLVLIATFPFFTTAIPNMLFG